MQENLVMARRRKYCKATSELRPLKMLRELRAYMGFYQHEFAEALGVSTWRLGTWERGQKRPPKKDWQRVVQVLVDSLVKDVGDRRWAKRFVLARIDPLH